MNEQLDKIYQLMEDFKADSDKQVKGNKSAGARARKASLALTKELKVFRGLSVAL